MNRNLLTFSPVLGACLIGAAFFLGWWLSRRRSQSELRRLILATRQALRGEHRENALGFRSPEILKLWQLFATFLQKPQDERQSLPKVIEIGKQLSSAAAESKETAQAVGTLIKEKSTPEALAVAILVRQSQADPVRVEYCDGIPEGRIRECLLGLFDGLQDNSKREGSWGAFVPSKGSIYDLSLFDIGAMLSVPIMSSAGIRGMIWLGFRLNAPVLPREKLEFLTSICEYCSAAFDTAEKVQDRLVERERQRDLLVGMSHDLRAPGNSALYALRDLISGEAGALNEDQRVRLRIVEECLEDQLDMLADVIDLSRNQRGILNPTKEALALPKVLLRVVDWFRAQATHRGLNFEAPEIPSVSVLANPQHLKRIISNLLSNAIKYTDSGSVGLAFETTKDTVRVVCFDTGPGIPEHEQPLLFQEFTRLSGSTGRPGYGLGLVIAKELAEANGANLRYYPRPGGGSAFELELQRVSAAVLDSGSHKSLVGQILIIDDDPAICRTNKRYLDGFAHRILTATSTPEALKILEESPPEIIVSDVHIGATKADTILDFLKSKNRRTPTVLLSGSEDRSWLHLSQAELPIRWLTKPAGREELQKAVRELMRELN